MKYYFSLNMTTADFYPYYEGKAQQMVVTTTVGLRVQFPAMHMRKYLLSNGIKGYFCMETKNNKFLSLTKIA
jgi:hypothetical protein